MKQDAPLELLTAAQMQARPSVEYVVRRILPRRGISAIYGPSASGKSFIALDLAMSIAEGRDWFGYKTIASPVVYVVLEGAGGFQNRVKALCSHAGRDISQNLRFMDEPVSLLDSNDTFRLVWAIRNAGVAGGVVIIDTLNAAAPGAEENSSKDMGQIISAAKKIQAEVGGLVVLVHHTGKNKDQGPRGHSSLFAALDAAIEVQCDRGSRQWRLAKAKDDKDGHVHPFSLEIVALDQQSDGSEAVTSCVVKPGGRPIAASALKLTGATRIAWNAFHRALKDSGLPPDEDAFRQAELPRPLLVVSEDAWRIRAYAEGISEGGCESAKRKAFARARNTLMDKGLIETWQGSYWVVQDDQVGQNGTGRDNHASVPVAPVLGGGT